ncbi:restriction endonuclease subunit S [Mesorhizobium sp. M00.F.Ca.ET.170.01.1.1]|nr:restriction endonuclease subunit S [Mesorhizobium sp. M00.F.Ca.ET.170.01.1.1]
MTKWPRIKLGELAKISSGGTPSKSTRSFWNGDIPWVSPKDMKNDTIINTVDSISNEAISNSAAKIAEIHSILAVVRSGILAHSFPVAKISRPSSFNQDLKAITPDTARLDYEYLFWVLRAKETDILNRGVKKGATVHSLSNGFLEALEIPLPPLEEQRRIAALLDRASEIQRRAEAAQDRAHTIVIALFVDIFGDPTINPVGWDVVQLSNLAEVSSGITKGRKLKNAVSVQAPYMRVANVQDGRLDLSEVKTIEVVDRDFERYKLEEGDLLMTEGGDPDKLGRCAIWNNEIMDCLHQNHIFRVRTNRDQLLPEYAAALIGSPYGKKYFLRVAKRTTGIASINKSQLNTFPVLLPPVSAQHEFVRLVHSAKKLERLVESAARKANSARTALSAEVFA